MNNKKQTQNPHLRCPTSAPGPTHGHNETNYKTKTFFFRTLVAQDAGEVRGAETNAWVLCSQRSSPHVERRPMREWKSRTQGDRGGHKREIKNKHHRRKSESKDNKNKNTHKQAKNKITGFNKQKKLATKR